MTGKTAGKAGGKAKGKGKKENVIYFKDPRTGLKKKLFDVISKTDFEVLRHYNSAKIIKRGGLYKLSAYIGAKFEFLGTRSAMAHDPGQYVSKDIVSAIPIVEKFESEIFIKDPADDKKTFRAPLTTYYAYCRAYIEANGEKERIEGDVEVGEISIITLRGKASSYPLAMLLKRVKGRAILNIVQLFDFYGKDEFVEDDDGVEPHKVNVSDNANTPGTDSINYVQGFKNRIKDLSKSNDTIKGWILETISPDGEPKDDEGAKHLYDNIAIFRSDNLRRIGFLIENLNFLEMFPENPFALSPEEFEEKMQQVKNEIATVEQLSKESGSETLFAEEK